MKIFLEKHGYHVFDEVNEIEKKIHGSISTTENIIVTMAEKQGIKYSISEAFYNEIKQNILSN